MSNLIFHVADIHVRNSVRQEEYRTVLTKFITMVQEARPICVVIAGDLLHSHLLLSPESFDMSEWLITELSKYTKVVIIPGNHDINENNKARLDGISVITKDMPSDKVFYYKKNGLYDFEQNIKFGVFSLLDDEETYPINIKRDDESKYIALYHGMVAGSRNYNGKEFGDDQGTSKTIFRNYDIALLGDIHKFQYLTSNNTIAYPGPAIQQDFGEGTDAGFLIWNIDDWSSEFRKLENDYSFIKTKSIEEIKNLELTKYVNVRYESHVEESPIEQNRIEKEIRNIITDKGSITLTFGYDYIPTDVDITIETSTEDVTDINIQNSLLVEYFKQDKDISQSVIDKCIEINKEANESIKKKIYKSVSWEPENLKFSNMFGYGEANEFNLRDNIGLIGIFGPNTIGKSSIFEVLLYAIYGSTFKKTEPQKIVNHKKKEAQTEIIINSNGVRYAIIRTLKITSGGNIETTLVVNNLSDSLDTECRGGKRDIKPFLNKLLGTIEDFKDTAMSSQFDIQSVVYSMPSERMSLLERFLGLSIYTELTKSVKPVYDKLYSQILKFNKEDLLKDYSSCNHSIKKNTELLKAKQLELNGIENDVKVLTENIFEQGKQIEKIDILEIDLNDFNKKKTNINKEINELESDYDTLFKRIKDITKEQKDSILKDKGVLVKGQGEFDKIISDLLNKISDANSRIKILNSNISNAERESKIIDEQEWCRTTDVCKKCMFLKNAFESESKIKEYKLELVPLENQLGVDRIRFESISEKSKKIKSKINVFDDKISEINDNELNKSKLNHVKEKKTNLTSQLEKIDESINKFFENEDKIKRNKEIQIQINLTKENKAKKDEILKVKQREVNNITVELKVAADKISEINDKFKELEKIEQDYISYEKYYYAVHRDGLPKVIISKYINIINSKVNNILHNAVTWSANLVMEGGELELILKEANGFEAPAQKNASGMQVTLIGMAMRAALLLISKVAKCKFLLLDECLGSLDNEMQMEIEKVFTYLKSLFKVIVLISHVKVYDICNRIILIEKHDGFSKLLNR